MSQPLPVGEEKLTQTTGRGWNEWFAYLDGWGAPQAGHTATAAHLQRDLGLGAWYAQSIAVAYELERGMRAPGQRAAGGYTVDVRRTVAAAAPVAFAALTTPEGWNRWLTSGAEIDARPGGRYRSADGDAGTILAFEPPRRMRMTWEHPKHTPGGTVEFTVAPAGPGRSTVSVRHAHIATEDEYLGLKSAWRSVLDELRRVLASAP